MTLTDRDRRAIFWGAIALAGVLALHFVLGPWFDRWSEARERIAEAQTRIDAVRARLDHLLRLRERLVERYGAAATQPLADIETVRIRFFEATRKMAKAAGLQFPTIQPQKPRTRRDVAGVQFVPFQLKCQKCKLSQLARFLAELRKADVLVWVERVSAACQEKKPGQLEVSLLLTTLARSGGVGRGRSPRPAREASP